MNVLPVTSRDSVVRPAGGCWRIALLLSGVVFLIFNLNGREIGTVDSQPAKYLALEIASHHTLTLNHVVGRVPALLARPGIARDRHGNYRTVYPIPSALFGAVTAWILAALRLVDLRAPLAATLVAKLTASFLAALGVGCAFLVASKRLSGRQAILVALAFGLATNVWATVSQTLWQQETWILAATAVIALLAARPSALALVGAASLLGLGGWARPQVAPAVVVLCLSVPIRFGWRKAWTLLPAALFAAIGVAINFAWFGHPLGAVPLLESLHPGVHGVSGSMGDDPLRAAAALLVSPSRGLLVFSPVVLVAVAGIHGVRREGGRSDLAWCLAAACVQFVAYSTYSVWWGGHTFGPRYALDVLPMLVPLAASGLPFVMSRRVLSALATIALAWSVLVAATGAFVYPAEQWNMVPADVDTNHARLWEWKDSQLPRCWKTRWNRSNYRLVSPATYKVVE